MSQGPLSIGVSESLALVAALVVVAPLHLALHVPLLLLLNVLVLLLEAGRASIVIADSGVHLALVVDACERGGALEVYLVLLGRAHARQRADEAIRVAALVGKAGLGEASGRGLGTAPLSQLHLLELELLQLLAPLLHARVRARNLVVQLIQVKVVGAVKGATRLALRLCAVLPAAAKERAYAVVGASEAVPPGHAPTKSRVLRPALGRMPRRKTTVLLLVAAVASC